MKIKKSDLLNMIQEQNDVIAKLIRQVNCHHKDIIRIEGIFEPEPQLKQLDQSIFNGLDEKWRFAVIQNNGFALICTKLPFVAFGGSSWDWNGYSDVVGKGYDTTDWQNSLIERDTAKELLEIDLSSELTGSDLARAMLARGDYHVMCAVSDISESDAILSCNSAVITSGEIRGAFTNSFDGLHEHAVPINNQGEPLTASEVGL